MWTRSKVEGSFLEIFYSLTTTSKTMPGLIASGSGQNEVDISQLTTRAEILERLARLETHEAQLDERLSNLISSRTRLDTQLGQLEGLRDAVGGIQVEASHMTREVTGVAETAERVGGKVRLLDEEQVRLCAAEMSLYTRLTRLCGV